MKTRKLTSSIQKRNSVLLFFVLMCLSVVASAQKTNLHGKVISIPDKIPLEGAYVILEGEEKHAVTTDEKGSFIFENIKNGDYVMNIRFLGYKTLTKTLKNVSSTTVLGEIKLEKENTNLDEVVVKADAILGVTKGDTVQYNADAFKVNPDASAEDLVKKLPGVVVSSGSVQAQGETVKKVYVDGKQLFDQDPTLALKSLSADVIGKIEIFDEQSEQAKFTGFADGETTKAMNIVTRDKVKNSQFGKIYAGTGLDGEYMAGGTINLFNPKHRFSILGQTNNVNQQNFSSEDIIGVSSGGGRGAGRDFMVGNQSGISKTNAFGVNYSGSLGNKLTLNGSYFFNNTENSNEEDINQQYFNTEKIEDQIYTETSSSKSMNYNHRMNMRIEYNINDNNRLMIMPRLRLQTNESDNNSLSRSLLSNVLQTQSIDDVSTDADGINFSNDVIYMHKFAKTGRTISSFLSTTYSTNISEKNQNSIQNGESTAFSDSTIQFTDSETIKKSFSGRLSYTEPIGKYSQFMISAGASQSNEDGDKKVWDYFSPDDDYTSFNSTLSNVAESEYFTRQAGAGYKYRKDKLFLSAELNYQVAKLTSTQEYPSESSINQTFITFLPMAMLRYEISKNKNLNVFYRTSTNSPSVSQLQNTIDNTNSLRLSTGNPNLKETFQHHLMVRYSAANKEKAQIFFAMLGLQYTDNYIGNSTFYAYSDTVINDAVTLAKGGQLTMPVNMDKYISLNSFVNYGVPISKLKTNINVRLNYGYTHTPGIYNDKSTYTNNHSIGTGLVLASNISENVDFTVTSNTNYNVSNSNAKDQTSSTYLNQQTEASLNLTLLKSFVVSSSFSHSYYTGLSDGYNQSYYLLNVGLAKKIFKSKLGEIKLSVFDALNQNKSLTRTVSDSYIQDSRTNVLQRYFMLTFTYTFKNYSGSTTQTNDQRGDMPMGLPPGGRNHGGAPMGPPPGGF